MSAASSARGAARPRARRPVRTDHPDLSAAARCTRGARPTPLFVYVGFPPYHQVHTVRDLGKEAGDHADRVLELTAPDGAVALVADCAAWGHECNCEEFRRRQDCRHIRSLEAAGALELARRFATAADLDTQAGGGE